MKRLLRAPGRAARYVVRRAWRPAVIRHLGVRLALDPHVLSPAIIDTIYRGGYEAAEEDIVRPTMSPDDRVLEIGGGLGFIGIVAARLVRTADQVLIVEANPHLLPLIRHNCRLNGVSPTVRNGVLGKSDAEDVSFYLHADFWASSLAPFPGAVETKVPQQNIATVFEEFRPTYLIVDIEGGEIDLFDNLRLDGIDKLCLEVHPSRTGQEAVDRLFAAIVGQGFALERTSRLHNVVFFRRRRAVEPRSDST